MSRRLFCLAPAALAAAFVGLSGPTPPQAAAQGKAAQDKADHPRLRAALHEMREARNWVQESRAPYPPGMKESALVHIDAAIESVRAILSVRDVNSFVGYDRNKDYYNKFKDVPQLRSALADLRDARDELRASKADFAGNREKALDDIDVAVGNVIILIRVAGQKK